MSANIIINALNGELARVVKSANTDTINLKNELTTKWLSPLEEYATWENKIGTNESLSPQGKLESLKKHATVETMPKLAWTKKVITQMADKAERYRTQFFTITSGIENPAERMPTFTYIWGHLDSLDPHERLTRFLLAAESNQVVILSAMMQNPFGEMIDAQVKTQALTERAKRLFPQEYDNFEQNQLLLEYMTMVRDWVGRWAAQEVGVQIKVIRDALGDEIADVLTVQTTGIPTAA